MNSLNYFLSVKYGTKRFKLSYLILLSTLLVSMVSNCQEKKKRVKLDFKQWHFPAKDSSMYVTAEQQKELYATEAEMKWFKDAKLGIFVHWGPALFETRSLSWGRHGERPGSPRLATKGVKPEIYDNLYKKFNPVNFDADQWMQQVKDFGADYLVFTAKHHDGFAFFDAKNSDYTIMNSPYGKDICKQLADAAHKAGVKLFWYYSQPDWTHPDNLREKHYENYLPYMKEHIKQLYTEYGKMSGIWWDNLGTKYWQWDTYNLYKKMKKWQPGILTNPRNGFGWPLKDRGDFDSPEQGLGPVNHHRYWESCITITGGWLFTPTGPVKPYETILGMLVQIAGNGGNLLLNFGPNAKGEFAKRETKETYKIGHWMKQYGHTLKNTRRGIYIGGDYGSSTQVGNKLYIHVLQQFADNTNPVIELPQLPIKIKNAKGITKGFKNYKIKNGKLYLYFDRAAFDENIDNIVELTLAKDPSSFDRIETWNVNPVSQNDFIISESSSKHPDKSAAVIYSDLKNVFSEGIHLKSSWEPKREDTNKFIQLDFKAPKKIKTVMLSEHMGTHCIRAFHVEVKNNQNKWTTVYTGTHIGEGLRIKLNGETVYGVRFSPTKSTNPIRLKVFNVYE